MKYILFGSVLASVILFSGCNSGVDAIKSEKQPHIVRTPIASVDVQNDEDIWHKFVSMSASYDKYDNNFILDINCQRGISSDVAHFQIYLDTDHNAYTGFSDDDVEYAAIVGADYMIEDGSLYKSTSTSSWTWEYIDELYYVEETTSTGEFKILVDDNGAAATMFNKNDLQNIRVSIEPIDAEWSDTGNFVTMQDIPLKVIDEIEEIPSFSGDFANIQKLIYDVQEGNVQDARYISVGDSTRAIDETYQGGGVYRDVEATLHSYNMNSTLEAVAGHALRKWNNYDGNISINEPVWESTVAEIAGDGSTSIVNISLGINDARYYGDGGEVERIKFHMGEAIDKILALKPKTLFMLTMPNKLIGLDTKTAAIKKAYEEMSAERNIPLINTIDVLFSGEDDLSLYRAEDAVEYGESIRVHLSDKGQALVSDLILRNILP